MPLIRRASDGTDRDRTTAASAWAYIRTETGSAAVLLAAAVAALIWVNAAPGSYETAWATHLSVRLGAWSVDLDLREWVNSGLMTLFFLVVGLEARREFDLGELRDRRRIPLPMVAGIAGMVVPVAIYLAVNAGRPSMHGWGTAMSTDTAFALGMLALLGSRFPRRLHTFILTVAVVDDFVALAVIAVAYSDHISWTPLLVGVGILLVVLAVRRAGVRRGLAYAVLGIAAWVALLDSGVDPLVVGLVLGLLSYAYPAPRDALERATGLFRSFREQPTAELEREARLGITLAVSPNDRLQRIWHPWSSYVIVPLFALANAGIQIDGALLSDAFTSPITLGILLGYGVGKPVGIVGASALATRFSRGRMRPPVGWAAVLGGGTIAGIGFTVSLLIATLAFDGRELEQAKIGVLSAVVFAMLATTVVALVTARLPEERRARALLGTAKSLVDLAEPVDPARDHVRGPLDAPVTVVEYGDFECPYCGQAEDVVRELLADFGDVRYVWRHLPLADVHPHAQMAAEAAEAAAAQGRFWEMHDRLMDRQEELKIRDLLEHAQAIGLDVEIFQQALRARGGAQRIARDMESAALSGVSGTPTFFVNGRRHHGAYDIHGLSAAVLAARDRALLVERGRDRSGR
ncbi:Na+/H+ antiporter NhaA [Streptomyces sp.]|uniref:Na+/H+ antiporter NhaA n=1 Tax=Streptomyces sp. TaxID=1931 RepID=UPI002F3F91BE